MRPTLATLVNMLASSGRPVRRRRYAPQVLVAALALVLALLVTMPSSGKSSVSAASPARPGKHGVVAAGARPAVQSKRIYWGAWIGNQFTGQQPPWDMRAVMKFERLVGKGLSVIHFSSPFADCRSGRCTPYDFPTRAFDNVRSYGAIPFFRWG